MEISLDLQPCFGNRSGVGEYTFELTKRLICEKDMAYKGAYFNFLNRHDHRDTLKDIPFPVSKNVLMPYGIYRRIWKVLPLSYHALSGSHSDIYHFFNYIVPPRIKGKVINTVYDMAFLKHPETLDPKNLKRIKKDISYSINRSEKIITISENSKKEIMDFCHLPENKIKIIYPAPSLPEKSADFAILSGKHYIKKPYLLYVGTLEPRKNIERLIDAYFLFSKETDGYQLVIAGNKGWMYDAIFEKVKNLSMENNVIFTGYITEEEKKSLYENASLFLYPSLYEGFGMPIAEAMSLGVPVICSNTSAMPEVGGEAAVLVNPFDIKAMEDAMLSVISDTEKRKQMSEKGVMQSRNFNWDTSAKELVKLYSSVGKLL